MTDTNEKIEDEGAVIAGSGAPSRAITRRARRRRSVLGRSTKGKQKRVRSRASSTAVTAAFRGSTHPIQIRVMVNGEYVLPSDEEVNENGAVAIAKGKHAEPLVLFVAVLLVLGGH